MDALSPRDANAGPRMKAPQAKSKAPVAKVSGPKTLPREKDHPPAPPPEVLEPPSLDRPHGAVYHTGKLLGKGGFAICHEGILDGTHRKIALKIVKSHMPQKKMEQKFQTELQIHSKMRHANIVEFHRAFTFQQSTYIVLELCPHGSLMDMVKRRKFVTEPEVRFYTVQMAGAIKYMHAKGIIHRDLKMGNIFLDKDMNVKIGDFGLAAMLLSGKDMTTIRRTTLCGTPNYIAPEILEKNKKGHDHAVDIWSLGIIIFALLTGRPPFQSTTQEEIYRKARELDYDWPALNTSENSISEETKDLVATLLQKPEDRPDPDAIVCHPFFTCGYVPQPEEITPDLKELHPDPMKFMTIGRAAGKSSAYISRHKKLCIQSEVGPYSMTKKIYTSTYREVTAEEKAGLTPMIPLSENVVYRPYDEYLQERSRSSATLDSRNGSSEESLQQIPQPYSSIAHSSSMMARAAPQSFAAQQRAQYQPSVTQSTMRSHKTETTPNEEAARKFPRADGSGMKSSKAMPALNAMPSATTEMQVPASTKSRGEAALATAARLGADLVRQLASTQGEKSNASPDENPTQLSLFRPDEGRDVFPATQPDRVLRNVQALHAELERALNSRSVAAIRAPPVKPPVIVVKWVDYTNKFGLGYILSNGGVGCIFSRAEIVSKDTKGYIPTTCVLVRDAERHLQNRANEKYPDRHQLVPVSGPKIEFFEHRGEEGLSRVRVSPREFAVSVSSDGKVGNLARGRDEYDDRKRQKIILWKKFANYMTAFGRDQDFTQEMADVSNVASEAQSGCDVVSFYQRFGDVGCWGFGDGHFQFNFPDHTKILLSADGTWCDFYHLPIEAAQDLAQNKTLPPSALDNRQHLSYPVQTLLNFATKATASRSRSTTASRKPQVDPSIQGVPEANDFRRKIEFIKKVVAEWIKNGGLGNSDMSLENRQRWLGHRECLNIKVPYKHVWATVGARGGDDRKVAWFDPRRPAEIVADIEA